MHPLLFWFESCRCNHCPCWTGSGGVPTSFSFLKRLEQVILTNRAFLFSYMMISQQILMKVSGLISSISPSHLPPRPKVEVVKSDLQVRIHCTFPLKVSPTSGVGGRPSTVPLPYPFDKAISSLQHKPPLKNLAGTSQQLNIVLESRRFS